MAWHERLARRQPCSLHRACLHMLCWAAPALALDAPRTLNCAAPVDIDHVRTLRERSNGDFTLMRAAARRYLHSLIDAPVAAGCELVSLTHRQLHVPAASSSRGSPAQDIWPPEGPVQPLAQPNGVNTVNGTEDDIATARQQRHALWTQAAVIAAVPPAVQHQSVAIVVTSDDLDTLEEHLELYALHLLTKVLYARYHSYDCFVYARAAAMPTNVTGHFSKIPGTYAVLFGHGYEYVLLLDWDTYIDPLAAVPLPALLTGFDAAGVFTQFELNGNSGVMAFRRQDNTQRILHQWWEWGLTTAFRDGRSLHDQAAWKVGLFTHLWQLTDNSAFWNQSFVPQPGRRNEPHHPKLWQYLKEEDRIRARSDYGFVGLSAQHDYTQVALHSCGGFWWGCIPKDAPALVQHHGRQRAVRDVIHAPLTRVVQTWLAIAIDRSRISNSMPRAAAAAEPVPLAPQSRRMMAAASHAS